VKVELLPQAAADLDGIIDPLYGRVMKRLNALGRFPELGSPMAGAYVGYRSTVVDLFRIVYRLRPDQAVEIAFIRNCRRQLPPRS
jgi:plasmid stabilization system protein ParE